jgi:hypothetical protein
MLLLVQQALTQAPNTQICLSAGARTVLPFAAMAHRRLSAAAQASSWHPAAVWRALVWLPAVNCCCLAVPAVGLAPLSAIDPPG